ncbi:MAG: PGPGW domain-containing protein [Candidatus Sumerlaeia bacterium]|nr:PGPGW domain-containing protein [Candidatus Sumerlaeia bacterium]
MPIKHWRRWFPRRQPKDPPEDFGDATLRNARRVVVFVVGTTVLLLGVAMIPMPGPGLVVLGAGVTILALEFAFARVWLRYIEHGTRTAVESAKHHRLRQRLRVALRTARRAAGSAVGRIGQVFRGARLRKPLGGRLTVAWGFAHGAFSRLAHALRVVWRAVATALGRLRRLLARHARRVSA